MGGHRASGAGDDLVDGPVDLAAVRADDALLDAIAGGAGRSDLGGYGFGSGSVPDGQADDERLAAVLAAWRADIEADPMPELVGLDEAVEAVTAGHEAHDRVRSRARRRMPFAVAAAATIVAVAGMTVAVHGAKPGDTLFGVSKVFFSEHAAQVQQVEDVRSNIERANEAINRGDEVEARRALEAADLGLPALPAPDRDPLETRRDEVQGSLAPQPPAASSPSRPSTTSPDGQASQRPGARPERVDPRTVPDAGTRPTPVEPAEPSDSPSSPDVSPSDPTTDTREAPASPPTTTTTQGIAPPPASSTTN